MLDTGAGTGIMLAIAAVLWFLYLLPTWMQKRAYGTERAAERLQATMDAIAAREELRARHAEEDAERAAAAAQARYAEELEERARDRAYARDRGFARVDPVLRHRIRRTRALASALMVGATVVALAQLWLMSTTGASVGAWIVLTGALLAGVVAIAVQRRLDVRATSARRAAPPVRREARIRVGVPITVEVEEPARQWTPVGLPAPRTAGAREALTPRIDPERLRREAEERDSRAGRPAPEVVPFRPRTSPERPVAARLPVEAEPATRAGGSRWAAMGRLDESAVGAVDLDAAMRRRRSAG